MPTGSHVTRSGIVLGVRDRSPSRSIAAITRGLTRPLRRSRHRPEQHGTMQAKITTLPGDGIGPEIVSATRLVLDTVAPTFNHTFT